MTGAAQRRDPERRDVQHAHRGGPSRDDEHQQTTLQTFQDAAACARHGGSRRGSLPRSRSGESAGRGDTGARRVHRTCCSPRTTATACRRAACNADGTLRVRRAADGDAAAHHRGRQVRFGDHRGDGAARRRRRRSTWRASARGARCSTSTPYGAAAAAVATVPSDFNYSIEHSENTGRQNNAIFASTISRRGSRSPTTRE